MKKLMLYLNAFLLFSFTGCAIKPPDSIGIIGGADGPTAFYILLRIFERSIAIVLIAAVIGIIVFIIKRKKK